MRKVIHGLQSSAEKVIFGRISNVHHSTLRLSDLGFYILYIFNVYVKTNKWNYTCDIRDNPSYGPPAHRIGFKNSHYWSPEVKSFSFSTVHSRLHNHLKQTLIFQASTGSAGLLLTSIRWALARCHFSCEHEWSRSWSSRCFVANSQGAACAPWQQLGHWFHFASD